MIKARMDCNKNPWREVMTMTFIRYSGGSSKVFLGGVLKPTAKRAPKARDFYGGPGAYSPEKF